MYIGDHDYWVEFPVCQLNSITIHADNGEIATAGEVEGYIAI